MKIRFKNIVGALLLTLFFLLPLIFRAIDRNFEVFPSITLPSNANQIYLNKTTSIVEHRLYGLDREGNRKKLDHRLFFGNIPIQYSHWIIRNNFGLDKNRVFHRTTPHLGIDYSKSQKVTTREVEATQAWIGEQLRQQQLQDSILIVGKHEMLIRHGKAIPIDEISTYDTVFKRFR